MKRYASKFSVIEHTICILADNDQTCRFKLINNPCYAAFETAPAIAILDAADRSDTEQAIFWYSCNCVIMAFGWASDIADYVVSKVLQPSAYQLIAVDVVGSLGLRHVGSAAIVG